MPALYQLVLPGWTRPCFLGLLLAVAARAAAPSVEPPRMDAGPLATLDGALKEPCWTQAAALDGFLLAGTTQSATRATSVRLLRDDAWLYLGVTAETGAAGPAPCTVRTPDGPVILDDSIEIFLDPGTAGRVYFHFMLNAANTRADQRVEQSVRDRGWNTLWRTATRTNDAGWTAEIAIPLYLLSAAGEPGAARLNIARNCGSEQSAWAPASAFHDPTAFGILSGLAGIRPAIPFLGLGGLRALPYERVDGSERYTLLADLGADPAADRRVRLLVKDQPVSGRGVTVTQTLTVAHGRPQTLSVPIPVSRRGARTVLVRLQDAGTSNTLMTASLTPTNLPACWAYLDRSYYTTEETARVVCRLEPPPAEPTSLRVRVRGAAGADMAGANMAEAAAVVPLPLAAIPPGRTPLTVEFLDAAGEPVYSNELALVRRAPKPGVEWKVDQVNRVLLRDGRPYFPFGIILDMWKPTEIADARHFRHASEMGFNSVLQWCSTMAPGDTARFMEQAEAHDLNVLAWLAGVMKTVEMKGLESFLSPEAAAAARHARAVSHATRMRTALMFDPVLSKLSPEDKVRVFDVYYRENLPRVREAIRLMQDSPRLIGYQLYDEPPDGSYFRQYVHGRELYRQVQESDGYHPVFLVFSSYIPAGDEYVDWTDCLGTDPYWVPGNRRTDIRATLQFVAKIMALNDRRAAERRQVTWSVPLAEYWVAGSKRALTVPEQFCQTYLALIYGAKAIFYFKHPLLGRHSVEGFKALSKQMATLGPLCLTPEVPQAIAYDVPFRPELNDAAQFPDVHAALRQAPDGTLVLLAANARPYPVDAVFELACLGAEGTVRTLFNDRELAVNGGAFGERIEPAGTRAYRLGAPLPDRGSDPTRIRVRTTPHPELAEPETGVPQSGREGKKNLIPNPSFEETSFPGWPDYFICNTPGLGMDYYLGDPDARYGLDTNGPVDGRVAVQMISRHHGGTWTMVEVRPREPAPTPYVFSVYMKADRDGMRAGWFAFNTPQQPVALTTEWQRYCVTGTVPVQASDNPLWGVRTDDIGTMWVDAMQLERGTSPTDFEP